MEMAEIYGFQQLIYPENLLLIHLQTWNVHLFDETPEVINFGDATAQFQPHFICCQKITENGKFPNRTLYWQNVPTGHW